MLNKIIFEKHALLVQILGWRWLIRLSYLFRRKSKLCDVFGTVDDICVCFIYKRYLKVPHLNWKRNIEWFRHQFEKQDVFIVCQQRRQTYVVNLRYPIYNDNKVVVCCQMQCYHQDYMQFTNHINYL